MRLGGTDTAGRPEWLAGHEGRPLRVLLVNTGRGTGGGMESYTANVARALGSRGHAVTVFCAPESRLESVARAARCEVVTGRVLGAADVMSLVRFLGVKFDVIQVDPGREWWPAVLAARLTGRKSVIVRHQMESIQPVTAQWLVPMASAIIAAAGAVRDALARCGVPPQRIRVIPGGVDTESFRPGVGGTAWRLSQGVPVGSPAVGIVGRVSAAGGKGHDDFLDAAAKVIQRVPAARFFVVGLKTPDEAGLDARVSALGLDARVTFTGFLHDLPPVYDGLDVVVMASRTGEAIPLVLQEAQACGKPVVATAVGGVLELVRDGQNGLIIPPGSSDKLAEAILSLLTDRAGAARMGAAGRARIEAEFSAQNMADRYESLYRELLA